MNVIMIVADTVVTDYLGVHGGHVHTPNLDRLAAESVDFVSAQAASFPTVPARADYLTGRYALTDIGWGPLPRDLRTLPEYLAESGVSCCGVVDTPFYKVKGYNYDRGFRWFADIPVQDVARLSADPRVQSNTPLVRGPWLTEHDHCAPVTFTEAEKHLDLLVQAGEPFFLYVDTWDPHEPWDAPRWYTERYLPGYDGRLVKPAYATLDNLAQFDYTADDVAIARACYSGKLEMVDRWLGRFLDSADALGLRHDTAVIFTTDHGFCFGEHGLFGKMIADRSMAEPALRRWLRSPLWRDIVNVPLFVRLPGNDPRVDERLVSAVDLAPTITDIFGLEAPDQFLGRSLLPLVTSPQGPGREVAISAMPLANAGSDLVSVVDDITRQVREWQPVTVTTDDWTMLWSVRQEPCELYDRRSDPNQTTNVAADHPSVVERLHALMIGELEVAGASAHHIDARR